MIIDLNSMVHIPAISWYNNNFYTVKESNTDSVLLVESRDNSHEHDVYVCEWIMDVKGDSIVNKVGNKVFLGSATESDTESNTKSKGDDTVLVVELLRAYT